ncbi:MAG: TIGR00730 family Rossman fold protein [Endomicrobium sp.]|jgi:uncharacterized protein (TIGR00730 family)|nr:TIGR00730 family Rossman fold protein [Endomicrobium sp.]
MKRVCVFCGSSIGNNPSFQKSAEEFGKLIASFEYELIYGGGKAGLMGVLADSVLSNGGKVTGIIPDFLKKHELAHKGVSKLIVADSMHSRKKKMYDMADCFIALPGGIGTMDELCEILTWQQLKIVNKPTAILNIDGYFDNLTGFFKKIAACGFIEKEFLKRLIVSKSAKTIFKLINKQTGY